MNVNYVPLCVCLVLVTTTFQPHIISGFSKWQNDVNQVLFGISI